LPPEKKSLGAETVQILAGRGRRKTLARVKGRGKRKARQCDIVSEHQGPDTESRASTKRKKNCGWKSTRWGERKRPTAERRSKTQCQGPQNRRLPWGVKKKAREFDLKPGGKISREMKKAVVELHEYPQGRGRSAGSQGQH